MKRGKLLILLVLLFILGNSNTHSQNSYNTKQDSITKVLKKIYNKREVMITMRDGVKLFTAIYEPKDSTERHPMMLQRTPYSCSPYGDGFHRSFYRSLKHYIDSKYIIVIQDVRGRNKSEGVFVQIRPLTKNKKDTDEATDTYDTIEWLIHNTYSNQRVGTWGISYDGFYATMTASSNHPALKAVSPQAPVTDWFRGDDRHHNGAFTLLQTTNFIPGLEGRNFGKGVIRDIVKTDVYTDFLKVGTFRDIDMMVRDSGETMWNNIKNHPNFDKFWKTHDARQSCHNLKPAILVTGGLFDSEDCYGAWELYKAIKKQSPKTELNLAFGPWWHGGWTVREFQGFGNIYFGNSTSQYYQDNIEYPFFRYYLEGKGEKPKNMVNVFFTGENRWEISKQWPLKNMTPTPFYIHENGSFSSETPIETSSSSSYISDMEHPVPYTAYPTTYRIKEFLVDDQRFAASRPDVLTFVSQPLTDTLRIGGPIEVNLKVAIEGTDADFMVKVIDVYPEGFNYTNEIKEQMNINYPMSGYQFMVRGELFRGRFRKGFDNPQPFTPGKITDVSYTLYDAAHTFLPGHRVMVQIQSSWFPIIDRNPQRFVDTYKCGIEDFLMKQEIKIFHQKNAATNIVLPIIK